MNIGEQDLLQRVRFFDRQALTEVYDRSSPELYSYAYRLLGDANLSEDCVSETFSRFLGALQRGKGPRENLRAYLYRIAHNWITDFYRHRTLPEQELDEELQDKTSPSTDTAVDLKTEQKEVRLALSRLTPDQRQVLSLRFIEGWEIHRATASLRRLLDQKMENNDEK
jgi:RNA polymerase sigma-70 factor (ECF subfamily)